MQKSKNRVLACGCLGLVAGVLIGASVATLALLAWVLARPQTEHTLPSGSLPAGYEFEVRLSQAMLNKLVAHELARRQVDALSNITLDAQAGNRLVATLEARFDLGGLVTVPSLEAEVVLGVQAGGLTARIERLQAGPLTFGRETAPGLVRSLLQSVEEAIDSSVNDRLSAAAVELWEIKTDEDGLTLGVRGMGPSQ